MDMDTKQLKKNAFRVTKQRGITTSRIRVPGGHLEVKYLPVIQEIAEKIRQWNCAYYKPTGLRDSRHFV